MPDLPDPVAAFVPGPRVERPPLAPGRLSGCSFAVKDLFDIAGAATGYGNPDWARTHPPAAATAPIIQSLLLAGARLAGKTKTVELAYGLTGENIWYGTPANPRAPGRFPGGSSCGSAAAVAAELVDFAMGSDTGGSVRIPASYCGLYGIRPTHGAVSLAGARPLAPSFDTPGWFSRSAALLEQVGDVLLPPTPITLRGPLLRVDEAWMNASAAVVETLRPAISRLESHFGHIPGIQLLPEGLPVLFEHFRCVQAEEAWACLGDWISAAGPKFGPSITERFMAARSMDPARAAAGRTFRRALQARALPLLAGGTILVVPTSPCEAPPLDATVLQQNTIREATMGVTAIAGFCGAPEVTVPAGKVQGLPVGLSFIAAPGTDRALLAIARQVASVLRLPE